MRPAPVVTSMSRPPSRCASHAARQRNPFPEISDALPSALSSRIVVSARAVAEDQQTVGADAAVPLADGASERGDVGHRRDLALVDEKEVVPEGVALDEVHS